ncbi:MAG: YfdX family protein [Reyranella sp.]|uniref:YfdX family protein n=1 Tax=Reyranella sp. TaxID=1929291 RepID=UPI002730549E|nr:YfdX family protein [Reyranella sp.]MDP1965656.1 YfdX family protein [Reyranella sp.]MDP2372605.1 YfdX family protein [Reyranella sp.]
MKVSRGIVAALLGTTMLAGVVSAQQTPAAPAPTTQQKAEAARDFMKLSTDGAVAFRALHLARIAIFEADPVAAKKLIADTRAALAKAKVDSTAFMKAEAALKAPKGMNASPAAATATASGPAVAWLPIDGQLTLGEDFVATPAKAAAVADANKHLEKGQRKEAIEKLKLADVNVMFTMALAPLDRTMADVDMAAKLMDEGKYYEANAAMKKAEDGVRYDSVAAIAVPEKAAAPKTQ